MMLLAALAGGALGAIGLSVATLAFHWAHFRRATADGQYALVFMVTVPVGIIIGAMNGLTLFCLSQGWPGLAERIAVGGGAVLASLFLLLGWFVFSGTERSSIRQRLTTILFWFGPPLFWLSLMVLTTLAYRYHH